MLCYNAGVKTHASNSGERYLLYANSFVRYQGKLLNTGWMKTNNFGMQTQTEEDNLRQLSLL